MNRKSRRWIQNQNLLLTRSSDFGRTDFVFPWAGSENLNILLCLTLTEVVADVARRHSPWWGNPGFIEEGLLGLRWTRQRGFVLGMPPHARQPTLEVHRKSTFCMFGWGSCMCFNILHTDRLLATAPCCCFLDSDVSGKQDGLYLEIERRPRQNCGSFVLFWGCVKPYPLILPYNAWIVQNVYLQFNLNDAQISQRLAVSRDRWKKHFLFSILLHRLNPL